MPQLQDLESVRQALRQSLGLLDAAEAAGEPVWLSLALLQVSRCQRRLGALADAVWYAKRSLQIARSLPAVVISVDVLCELAELALARAELLDQGEASQGACRLRDSARNDTLDAARLALHAGDPQWELAALLRASDLFDRLGDHDDAIALQCRAVSLMTCAEPALAFQA
jgi:hypothetical protein